MDIKCNTCLAELKGRKYKVVKYDNTKRVIRISEVYCEKCYEEYLHCYSCKKSLSTKEVKYVSYSLKRGVRLADDSFCIECFDEYMRDHSDDFCPYCKCNSYGSIPCVGCKRMR